MCRCIGIAVLLFALSMPFLLQFLRGNKVMKGTAPALVNEWKYRTPDDIPDLTGKLAIVTGANVGLGKSSAMHLSGKGAKVVMACRSQSKCQQAIKDIKKVHPAAKLEPMLLDLGSLKSVKQFADEFLKEFSSLDILMLNAGIMHTPFTLTEDGLESQFQVNHLGHFYLTKLLLPVLKRSQPAYVVSVSSNGHFGSYSEGVKLNEADLIRKEDYNPIYSYGQSKLCNVLFAQELAKRLNEEGVKDIYINSLNPGGVNTELLRQYPEFLQYIVKHYLFRPFPDIIFFEPDTAALTQVYAATATEIREKKISGKYFVPVGELCDTSYHAKNMTLQSVSKYFLQEFIMKPAFAKGLWEFSETLLKERGFL